MWLFICVQSAACHHVVLQSVDRASNFGKPKEVAEAAPPTPPLTDEQAERKTKAFEEFLATFDGEDSEEEAERESKQSNDKAAIAREKVAVKVEIKKTEIQLAKACKEEAKEEGEGPSKEVKEEGAGPSKKRRRVRTS